MRLHEVFTGARAQAALWAALFALMVFLLVMSSRTGQREFDDAKRRLDAVEAANLRLDGSMFFLTFELQMDFDLLTQQQRDLTMAAAELAAALPAEEAKPIRDAVTRKLELVDDFKTEQAVLRNSRAIIGQTFEMLWRRPEASAAHAQQELFAVERAFLDFIGRRDPVSAGKLRSIVAQTAGLGAPLTASAEWSVLEAHLLNLVRYVERVGEVLMQTFFVPLPQTISAESARLAERLAVESATAGRYRIALFTVAVLLLVFSVTMAARVRSYLRTIERTNDELESRVAKRTEELAGVNAALLKEIAERENVESQLRMAQKLESIGQLAAGIAHEINTPVQYVSDNVAFLENVWRGLTALLDDYERSLVGDGAATARARAIWSAADLEFLRTEVPAALRDASEGLEQISRIVLAMKKFSHPGTEGMQPANVNEAVENTVVVARNEWKYIADLVLDLDPELPHVPCDVSAINQVVLNLVVNAAQAIGERRAGGPRGRIEVSSRRLGDSVEISVEDDGPGVPVDIRDRIFDPFFTTKEVGKGTGQGLAIAHRVIHRQHGGTLRFEEPSGGRGARFVIRLPIRPSWDYADSVAAKPRRRAALA